MDPYPRSPHLRSLLPELAPVAVGYFAEQVNEGLYTGTYFHRVIPGFMIQGGDPNTKDADPRNDGNGGGGALPDEFSDLPQRRGVVSLANRGTPNTQGSQFFIVHEDSGELTGSYTAFGRVVSGIEVVDAITALEIDKYGRYGPIDRPYPVSAVIESVRFEPAAGAAAAAPDPDPGAVALPAASG